MKSISHTGPLARRIGRKQVAIGDEARHLWTRLNLGSPPPGRESVRIGFCSTYPGEGTTSVATNFAISLGQQMLRTCLVEANLRSTALAKHFKIRKPLGLGEILSGDLDPEEAVTKEIASGVTLLPGGIRPKDIYSAMCHGAIGRAFEAVEQGVEVLVVDCPPVSTCPETGLILREVDAVVLVVQANRIRKRAVARSVATLRDLGVAFKGAVLNRMTYDLPVFLDRLL